MKKHRNKKKITERTWFVQTLRKQDTKLRSVLEDEDSLIEVCRIISKLKGQ